MMVSIKCIDNCSDIFFKDENYSDVSQIAEIAVASMQLTLVFFFLCWVFSRDAGVRLT
jgi:hypothetical protein